MSKDPPGETEPGSLSAPTEDLPEGFLAPGQVLGDRYQVRSQLGRGGMGEVWRAFDLKLRVEVALKAMREDLFRDARRRDLLRQEVRAAREVVSPNVCRIFDLIEADGRELVSMEYVDGGTLLEVLQERGPLELKEAQDIASQFLAGLEAIHKAGLIHRDVKPENIMLTRAGRVVVMDFGLARGEDSGAGTVSGTPAYMAPEQAAGLNVDARADVYSAGVVLAEMVSPDGISSFESRQSVWEGMRSEPAKVPDSPWAPVLKKAVAKEADNRYRSAHTLTRALEDVTLRVEGAEDLTPYPGLASYTEADAEYFFGREAEIEQVWRRLDRPHLLSLVGPSGAGKSSFIRAGLIPGADPSWSIVRCTPGSAPLVAVGQAVAHEMAGDPEALELLVRAQEPDVLVEVISRWRRRHDHVLLIVDQFEELFTLGSAEAQRDFAELVARLPLEADAFVMLSMRDDFLIRCREHEALAPAFTDLTALLPPTGAALRRAVVQPALKSGYRFEDDELVEEMLAEVEGERGALPLLAFALARLWEKRDRGNGLLTRQAYRDIGGVGGALARHAEATLEHIGIERVPIVRELFRNLVTAEGTRAVREWGELLSVFGERRAAETRVKAGINPAPTIAGVDGMADQDQRRGSGARAGINPAPTKKTTTETVGAGCIPARAAAEAVLHALINARLLTSFEVHEEGHEATRRVEIIHESLLANWPRLVGWQTQDADSGRLRDELRQAARAWDEHGRPEDRLWTGSAFREYQLWRERYPGGLTETEQAFATAMTNLAGRRRRRRRAAIAAVLAVAATVAAVTTALWRRSVLHERRAEAQKLVALGKMQLEDFPTATLAHAIQSLELADSEEARFLALEALSEGPTAFIVNEDPTSFAAFSPDGSWLVQAHDENDSLVIISRDGAQRTLANSAPIQTARFGAADDLFLTRAGSTVALWSAPEGRVLASANPLDTIEGFPFVGMAIVEGAERTRAVTALQQGNRVSVDALDTDGGHEQLGTFSLTFAEGGAAGLCVPWKTGQWIGVVEGNSVSVVEIADHGLSDRRHLGSQEGELLPFCDPDPFGRFFLTVNRAGQIKLWDPSGKRTPATVDDMRGFRSSFVSHDSSYFFAADRRKEGAVSDLWIWSIEDFTLRLQRHLAGVNRVGRIALDPVGLWLGAPGPSTALFRLWSLAAPAEAEPVVLRRGSGWGSMKMRFSPDGRWLATPGWGGLTLWSLGRSYPAVIRPKDNPSIGGLAFGPEGRFLASAVDRTVSVHPLEKSILPAPHTAFHVEETGGLFGLNVSPDGRSFGVVGNGPRVWIGRDDGAEPTSLPGSWDEILFSPHGQHAALLSEDSGMIAIWHLTTGEVVESLRLSEGEFGGGLGFTASGRLLAGCSKGVMAWDFETGEHELLVEINLQALWASDDGRRLLVLERGDTGVEWDPIGSPLFINLDTGVTRRLVAHGDQIWDSVLSADGTVVATGNLDGTIRVGLTTGEEPHLLLGHHNSVTPLAIDPLNRWIASSGHDDTIRLWPMPDLSKPPLHTLPRAQLIAKLKTLTNIRLVRDVESSTGWRLGHEPFQGWETAPSW